MINRVSIVAAASLLIVGLTGLPAEAQDQKPPEPKGLTVKGLVSSLGAFTASCSSCPICINLRMDECRITNQLVGIGLLSSRIDVTPLAHSPRDPFDHPRE